MKLSSWLVSTAAVSAALGLAIAVSHGAEKDVQIAFLNPLSGNNVDAGQQDLNAAQLAIEDINKAGGIKAFGGAQIKLVIIDTTSDPKNAASTAERVFSTQKVAGAVGTGVSGLTMPILPVAERSRIPIITNSVNDQITALKYKYTFQVTPKGSQFGSTQVQFLKELNEKHGYDVKDIAVVYENSGYGVSTASGIKEIAKSAGLNLVLFEAYPHGFTDASSLVTKIKASGAKALFPVAYTTDAKLIINTMKQMNVDPIIIGGGAGFLWPVFAKEMGPAVNGFVSVASWNWDSKSISTRPELAAITARYEEKFGTFMTEHAGPTYLAVRMLAEAMEIAKSSDPTKVRDALATFKNDQIGGFMQPGRVEFDGKGWNNPVHPVMIQWQDDKPRTVFPTEDSVRAFKK